MKEAVCLWERRWKIAVVERTSESSGTNKWEGGGDICGEL